MRGRTQMAIIKYKNSLSVSHWWRSLSFKVCLRPSSIPVRINEGALLQSFLIGLVTVAAIARPRRTGRCRIECRAVRKGALGEVIAHGVVLEIVSKTAKAEETELS